jgi:uncharacterized protein (DUF1330 family)
MSEITRVLIEALPYIQKFKDKAIVIKYGGNAMIRCNNRDSIQRSVNHRSVNIINFTHKTQINAFWFDLLYKIVGEGTRQLSERKIGDVLSIIGPIGNGFELTDKKRPLLIGGGVGMPPMICIAQQIKDNMRGFNAISNR